MMKRIIPSVAMAVALAAPASAVEPLPSARLGTHLDAISEALGADGYALTKFEHDDGRIEVTAIKQDRRVEAVIDGQTGEVTHVEARRRRGRWPLPGPGDAAIRRSLQDRGYEIVEYERERGRVEVEARQDGRLWDLSIDPRSGEVLSEEEER
jgi:hypothetical protein